MVLAPELAVHEVPPCSHARRCQANDMGQDWDGSPRLPETHYTVVASAWAERPHWYAHEVREPVSEELLPYLESGVHNGTTSAY